MAKLSLNPTARAFLRLRAISPHSAHRAGLKTTFTHHALNSAQCPERQSRENARCTAEASSPKPCNQSQPSRQAKSIPPPFHPLVCHYLTTIGSPESPTHGPDRGLRRLRYMILPYHPCSSWVPPNLEVSSTRTGPFTTFEIAA
jgi:hypothetical protein